MQAEFSVKIWAMKAILHKILHKMLNSSLNLDENLKNSRNFEMKFALIKPFVFDLSVCKGLFKDI